MKIGKLSEGAEAEIYSTKFLGVDSVIKKRITKNYRINAIDEKIRTQRTKNEARIMSAVSSTTINAPKVLLVDKYDIIMDRVHGENLNRILDLGRRLNGMGKIFTTIGEYAALLHNNNIVHGDYTPANFLVGKDNSVYLIDFGLSNITSSIEDKALDLLLMKRSLDKKSFEEFIKAYSILSEDAKVIIGRLKQIEKRGRYNTRTLMTK